MQEQIDLVAVEQETKTGGLSLSVIVSMVLHFALILWFLHSYHPGAPVQRDVPIARYVELMKQNPQDFVEAPGAATDKARLSAPLSDKNRRAAMPEPTGPKPTNRPGDNSGLYTPPMGDRTPRGPRAQQASPQSPASQMTQPQQPSLATNTPPPQNVPNDTFVYREAAQASAAAPGPINWKNALREVKVASLGGGDGMDIGKMGGEQGFAAEQGPLSFETRWYDWGDYAQSMVSKIRVNWYGNMPQIIRTGMKGVVTIRFTIHRDGHITDVTILQSSGVPPYDQAAKKAIELSSPLRALPKDFPNPQERVTCMFYYNMEIPQD